MSKRRPSWFKALFLIAVCCLSFCSTLIPASAQDQVCTLADHIRSANTNTAVGFCPAGTSHDIITIADDITLTEPLPPITGAITIEGGGHTISGGGHFRIFDVSGGNLTIRNLTLDNGKATEGSGGFTYMINNERVLMDAGGALRLDGGAQVQTEDTTFSDNSADAGGAIALLSGKLSLNKSSFVGNISSEFDGGAIFMRQGAVAITKSSFVDNVASWSGGALGAQSGSISVANSTFQDNVGPVGGSALFISGGEATLTHVTMLNNRTSSSGHAVANAGGVINLRNSFIAGPGGVEDCVGGLNQNSGNWSEDGTCAFVAGANPLLGAPTGSPAYLPLLDGSPALNAADPDFCLATDQIGTPRPQGDGCDIGAIESTTAIPAPAVIPDHCTLADQLVAANTDRPFGACPAGNGADVIFMVRDFTLEERLPTITSDITILGNGFTISGDGKFRIFDVDGGALTIHDLTLTKGFSPNNGGVILVKNGGKVSIENSKFVRNHANDGGAIAMTYPNRGVTINRSEFIHNWAQWTGGAIQRRGGDIVITNSSFVRNVAGKGGAIDTSTAGKVDITNSTFIYNSGRPGGAVYATGAITTLTHVTMLNNSQGIWMYDEGTTLNLRNSLIASDRHSADCWGRLTQNSGNLIEDGSCAAGISGDPMLDDWAGSSSYVSLKEGSPAIDAADPRFCPATDQIGTPRPQGAGCDIGAIESPYGSADRAEAPATDEVRANCSVTTTHALNFRDGPSLAGARIGLVREGATLDAIERTAGWIRVAYRGAEGWISADYVVMQGDCG
ncbi:MAG: SH3 domain-containing protein [Chloroflexota bacterium]|nr:SH3 domain-containing protein [Chloroflexota bacterium]